MAADEVHRIAARVQGLGDDVRRLADRTQATGAVAWRSTAAAELRRRLAAEVARMRFAASALDQATCSLRRHAAAVDEVCAGLRLGGPR